MIFPIAEVFHSIQGEGYWTGTPMMFVRLAGCSVGKQVSTTTDTGNKYPGSPFLQVNHQPAWLCHSYDGKPFWCDTDFNKYKEMTGEELLTECSEEHVCFTGGEPLIHLGDLIPLINKFTEYVQVHIETSGTVDWGCEPLVDIWLTVAPKQGYLPGMLERADEIKVLVDENTSLTGFPAAILEHPRVYLQPINYETEVCKESLENCLRILRTFPQWKLSAQLHKLIGVR